MQFNKSLYDQLRLITTFMLSFAVLLLTNAVSAQQTVNNNSLHTWWHDSHELNENTEVASNRVRRSTFYDVKVSTAADAASRFDSFTYMSIPRAGKGKVGYSKTDGAEFADNANLTMSWSSFLYNEDVWVEVTLRGNHTFSSVNQVTIRPSKLNFQKERVNEKTVRIRVPYSPDGYRFSVEFDSHLYTAYNDMSGVSGNLTENSGGRAIHTEPRNALLIFAEPILSSNERTRTVPTEASGTIHYPAQGEVRNLNNVNADIIYFRPGVYYMGRDYHAKFASGSRVKWIYIAPGAYVKGAFEFLSTSIGQFKFTGYGVLSGEQYIYEADTTKPGYAVNTDEKCHTTCVKMFKYESNGSGQKLDLQGITVNEPPYHSFVVYGNEQEGIAMNVNSYKQVGSWVWQTDGIELYKNSRMKNTFFHANDDVLKMYHSNVQIDNTVIWKGENGPVIQWGWDNQRNLDQIYVRNTDVIHSRLYWRDEKGNFCIINASPHWNGGSSNGNNWVRGITIEDTRVEGMTMCAIRIYSLLSIADNAIKIKNLHIDAWNQLNPSSHVNRFERIGDVFIGNNALSIENFTVGNQYVTTANNNTGENQLGRFGFRLNNWRAFQTTNNECTAQTISFPAIADQPMNSSFTLNASASSNLPLTYSIAGASASIVNGTTVNTGNSAGTVTVTAQQAGNATHCPATASVTFSVVGNTSCQLAPQAITFEPIPDKNLPVDPKTFDIYAMADSGLPLTYAIEGPATISGSTITLTGVAGTVTVTARQAGNSQYCAATQVIRSFKVATGTSVTHENAMYIGSTFNGWRPSTLPMTLVDGVWTVKDVSIAAGAHQLKFANTGSWVGKDWGYAQGLTGTAMETTGGAPNISFNLPRTANYTISFDDVSLIYSIEEQVCGNECTNNTDLVAGATYVIRAKHSNKALDVSSVSNNNGAAIHQWEYVGGANQQWKLQEVASGIYKLIAGHSNKALDINGGSMSDGANAHQWESLSVTSQNWKVESAGDGSYRIINSKSGKALMVKDATMNNGGAVLQQTTGNSENYKWIFEKI